MLSFSLLGFAIACCMSEVWWIHLLNAKACTDWQMLLLSEGVAAGLFVTKLHSGGTRERCELY